MSRVNLILIDKQKNTVEIELTDFMFRELNIDLEQVKKHKTKKALMDTISEFYQVISW